MFFILVLINNKKVIRIKTNFLNHFLKALNI